MPLQINCRGGRQIAVIPFFCDSRHTSGDSPAGRQCELFLVQTSRGFSALIQHSYQSYHSVFEGDRVKGQLPVPGSYEVEIVGEVTLEVTIEDWGLDLRQAKAIFKGRMMRCNILLIGTSSIAAAFPASLAYQVFEWPGSSSLASCSPALTAPMLRARASLRHELAGLERQVRLFAQEDPICRLLMSMPGIGAVVG